MNNVPQQVYRPHPNYPQFFRMNLLSVSSLPVGYVKFQWGVDRPAGGHFS